MRGSIKRRYKGTWSLILDLGREKDPTTGIATRRQKWVTFAGTKQEAETKLRELLGTAENGIFVEKSKLTLIEYLRAWLETSIKPPMRRTETYRVYRDVVENHIASSSIATLPLQKVHGTHLERYYVSLKLSPASVHLHHAVLHCALKKAVRDRLLNVNHAANLERPKNDKSHQSKGAREHCWTAAQAQTFLATTATAGPQAAAFFALALDTGARKDELHGLLWSDVNLDASTITIHQQLDAAGESPVFGPTKTKSVRTVKLGPETVKRLRAHKRAQATLKMENRTSYRDFGLVFAKEPVDLRRRKAKLGQPIATLGDSYYERLVKKAGVPRIKFHGLRHTCVTLLLSAGVPVHIVAQRVGHAKPSMTLDVYSHATANLQEDAATRLATILHG
jgi:integrase